MRILITGSAGYIGSALAERLKEHELVLVDNYSSLGDGRPVISKIGKHEIIRGDIINESFCKDITQSVDLIFHLAAISGIAKCEDPNSYESNITGLSILGRCAEQNDIKKIIFASSSAVYGEGQNPDITETHRIKPRSRYGNQKYVGELILQSLKIPVVVFRKSNVYGHALFHKKTAVDFFIDKALREEDLTIDGKGTQQRDYVNIHDVVDAYVQAMYWDSGVYNIGGLDNLSINDLADLVIKHAPKKVGKIYNSQGDAGRLLKNFTYNCKKANDNGYKPKRTVLEEIVQRFSNH